MSGKVKAAAIRESAESEAMVIVNDSKLTKSAKIRKLAASGVDRSTIASLLDLRYQHVRNVLVTKVNKED